MCGIAGIYQWSGASIKREYLENMVNSLAHRGPDGSGIHIDGPVGLGHRRLAIVDPALGQQPMLSDDGKVAVSFNGEIYNYRELRTELLGLGLCFHTDSDTEVILQAYRTWGEDCLKRFNGMWALAIWDAALRRLLLTRDRIGEKPLFYAEHDGALLFASEPKALFAWGYPAELDIGQLEIYLVLGYVPAPYSFFRGMRKLEPGHLLKVTERGIRDSAFWQYPQVPPGEMRTDLAGVREEFESLLADSVRLRMRSDVPFGAFLSGGLDSSSIVALMRRYSDDVRTFTIGFEEKAFDERDLARLVARNFSTHHNERVIGVSRTLRIYDEPFGDSSAIPAAYVCRFAAEQVKMVLTGDGGDEVLSGYPAYQAEKFGDLYQHLPVLLRKVTEGGLQGLVAVARGDLRYRLQRVAGALAAMGLSFRDRLITKSAWADMNFVSEILADCNDARPVADYLDEVFSHCGFEDPFYRLMYFHFRVSLPERMLTKVDRVSMSHSLECRAPFLDHRLVELMAGVSRDVKMPGMQRKYLLRTSVGRVLPREILTAPKRGFVPPLRAWLNENTVAKYTHLAGMARFGLNVDAMLKFARLNGTGRYDLGHFLWILLLLLEWQGARTSSLQ
jgi:asparagine synthase (glutamine-hydrolysing)